MIRFIAFLVSAFLFFSTVEAYAWVWLAGRWFYSSRFASLTLGVVKRWLDRGLITRGTQYVKAFIQRNGKWILLTLAISEVIRELEKIQSSQEFSSVCYVPQSSEKLLCYVGNSSNFFCYGTGGTKGYFDMFPEIVGDSVCGLEGYVPAHRVYRFNESLKRWERMVDMVPSEGKHLVARTTRKECYLDVSLKIPPCPFVSNGIYVYGYPPSVLDLDKERREVPTRVYPNPADFIRPDVVESDPALRWLRDEYQRISQDASIPDVSSDLAGVSLPQVGWSIPPEEAVDSNAESSGGARAGSTSGSTDIPADSPDTPRDQDRPRDGDLPQVPGFDTSLPSVEKRSFPVELVNSIVQSHPLLRVLQGVSLDTGGGGSCVIGSRPFEFNFCPYQWVLNLMGGVIVFVAFLTGFLWAGRSD